MHQSLFSRSCAILFLALLALCLQLGGESTVYALDATPPPSAAPAANGPWTHFASPVVGPIITFSHTPNGYLWVGTRGGVTVRSPAGVWQTLTNSDGLASNTVFAILHDPINPNLHWFGTNRGASLLDDGGDPLDKSKHRWITFSKPDGLTDNRVTSLAMTPQGVLWFGLSYVDDFYCEERGSGIGVLDPRSTPFDKSDDVWQSYTAANSNLPNDVVRRMTTDAEGTIWIAMKGSLTAHQNGQWFTFSTDQGLPSNDITALAIVGHQVWLGMRQGFGLLDYGPTLSDRSDDRWQTFGADDELLKDVSALAIDEAGRVWIGANDFESFCSDSSDGGAAFVLDAHGTPFDLSDDAWLTITATQVSGVRGILLEPQRASFAIRGAIHQLQFGASPLDPTTHQWSTLLENEGFTGHSVRAVAAPGTSFVWFTEDGNGYRLDYHLSPHERMDDEYNSFVPADGARSLIVDQRNYFWNGGNGIIVRDLGNPDSSTISYADTSGLISNQVNEMVVDRRGWVWIASGDYLDGGVNVFDIGEEFKDDRDDRWATFTTQHSGLPAKQITAIALEQGNTAWFGSNIGLARLQYGASPFDKSDDVWTVFTGSNSGLPNDHVRDLALDQAGNLWIALAAGGVSVYTHDGAWVSFTEVDGLVYNAVNAVAVDKAGNVWMGTDGEGISVLNHANTLQNKQDDAWTTYRPGETLPSGFIQSLTVDVWGQVWVGAWDGGLSLYSTAVFKHSYLPVIANNAYGYYYPWGAAQ